MRIEDQPYMQSVLNQRHLLNMSDYYDSQCIFNNVNDFQNIPAKLMEFIKCISDKQNLTITFDHLSEMETFRQTQIYVYSSLV